MSRAFFNPLSPMSSTRRTLLKRSAAFSAAVVWNTLPRPLLASVGSTPEPIPDIQDPRLKALAQRGLDAAAATGATYADIRLTHTRQRKVEIVGQDSRATIGVDDQEFIAVGIRTLVEGYWGFASGPIWSPDELVRLGREAALLAKTNALGKPRLVEFAPVPAVPDTHWRMPVKRDPFDVWPMEIGDFLINLKVYSTRVAGVDSSEPPPIGGFFWEQRKAFAASNGSYCTQQLYRTEGEYSGIVRGGTALSRKEARLASVDLSPAGLGWEMFENGNLLEQFRLAVAEEQADLALPRKPVEIGRYDFVCDAKSLTTLIGGSLGAATELDRALGYEANAGGTSYLNDPMGMLNTFKMGSPLLTVTANRNEPGGAATVGWDDDGVAPEAFPLVKDGVLVDFQTTREGAGWLKDYYAKTNTPLKSRGCAITESGIDVPLTHTANLVMEPGPIADTGFNELIAGMSRGVAARGLSFSLDFQQLNGFGRTPFRFSFAGNINEGQVYEIRDGKRVARLGGGGVLLRAPEFWRSLVAKGGSSHARRYGLYRKKGEPSQDACHSVTAVPAAFKEVSIIDVWRKA